MKPYHKTKAEHLNKPLHEPQLKLYKGYWIKPNNIGGYWWIEKDGSLIQAKVLTIPEAERIIDELTFSIGSDFDEENLERNADYDDAADTGSR